MFSVHLGVSIICLLLVSLHSERRSLGLQGLDFTTVMITPSQWTFWQNSICLEGRQHIELKIMHKKSTEMMLRKNLSIVLNVIIV